ncbi:MAG: egtD [Alphaproteobacteria bacterium]|nr:egtD [Alphaproteobacteria bacterium]
MDAPRRGAVDSGVRAIADPDFRDDVLAGLASPIRAIPARWFYDRRGSELFEAITRLPEYYLTRADASLLERHAAEVAAVTGAGRAVVEFGSGSSAKTPILLRAVAPSSYVPIDISGDFLRHSAAELQPLFPDLPIHAVEADFMVPVRLPEAVRDAPKLGFFPGSTIGNLVAGTGVDLLRRMKDTLGLGSYLLIGMDRVKNPAVLLRAYDDAAGVTAAFNLNLLHRINRELGGTIPVEAFRHRALWNDPLGRIEMHLEAMRDVAFDVDSKRFTMRAGETIHTENSHKYGPRDARLLLKAGGWEAVREWTDPDESFALILAVAEATRVAP